jgi:CRISPR-associated protein Csx3
MANGILLDRKEKAMKLNIGKRDDFDLVNFSNKAGLKIDFYRNGGTHRIELDDLMVNQLEGHPMEGGLDRVYLRRHGVEGIEAFSMSGTAAECAFHENGVQWTRAVGELDVSVELVLHPELPVLFRVCHAKNTGMQTEVLDWLAGQDLGLAEPAALKSNEAYVCQYLDHRILAHPTAGKTVLSRNNLHSRHPLAVSFCLQGGRSASTDGYQFFGTASKLTGEPVALGFQTLEDRVKQYEFAYAALQSNRIELQPCQSSVTVFALYVMGEHPAVSSAGDLARVDEVLKGERPALGSRTPGGPAAGAFFAQTAQQPVQQIDAAELKTLFCDTWRHEEFSDRHELYSFFCGEDTHVVLPAKERVVERRHGTILKSAHGPGLDENVLCVTCYGYGAFGSQFSVGNTTFGRFTTIERNSLNLDRSSGIRLFMRNEDAWCRLAFPSVFAMERDRVRWIYKTEAAVFEISARATSDSIEYSAASINGPCPPLRLTLEVCGDANEFDAAPAVEWDAGEKLLTVWPAEGSLLKSKFPESCLLARLGTAATCRVRGAEAIGGNNEPYVVIDVPSGGFSLSMTGHYEGRDAARARFAQRDEPDWNALMARFRLKSDDGLSATLSDTLKWYAHNAMIHYAAPRGMEQYGGGAWGTRDVCQGPLEFLLALGHDAAAADLLLETFSHQFADSGTWPQWFMFDGFQEIQQKESHGDIVFWPIKALCDYIEQSGDFRILDHEVPYTDPTSKAFTEASFSLRHHVGKAVGHIMENCVEGTALPSYGDGDWNDSLQPANREMKTHMVSGWTVGLAYQSLRALAGVWKSAGCADEEKALCAFLERMFSDFQRHVMADGVAAGFVLFGGEGTTHMLHPSDTENGIRCRLLPINRAIISELFTPAEKDLHLGLVEQDLHFPDGVRLMDRPPEYTGGKSVHFQRAETASHFGREIGLQYVHAHIRYCEALAKVGRAAELVQGLLTVSPVAIRQTVPNARPRQANLYFSSSDAEVYDRYEASVCLDELKKGNVGALGGWRLYSSGPGIYIGLVISRLFGIRRCFGRVEIDPVLPKALDAAELDLDLFGRRITWVYHVQERAFSPSAIVVNGVRLPEVRHVENPYRDGGISIDADTFKRRLDQKENTVEIYL